MKTITIQFDEETKKVEIQISDPTTYEDFLMLMLSASVTFANKVLEAAPEEHKHAVKGQLYDLLNIGASNALHTFAPEFEPTHTEYEEAELDEMQKFVDEQDKHNTHEAIDGTAELVEIIDEE